MEHRDRLRSLADDELLAGLSRIVGRRNQITADFLAYLAELDQRQLFLDLGYPSLFDYCVALRSTVRGLGKERPGSRRSFKQRSLALPACRAASAGCTDNAEAAPNRAALGRSLRRAFHGRW